MRRPTRPSNAQLADLLDRVADLLEGQQANPFRVGAYRRASQNLRALEVPAVNLLARGGRRALEALPGIGPGIAAGIDEYARTGQLALLDRLEGGGDPVTLFMTLGGIGARLARRTHESLAIDTLEQLEMAAHDGRLERVPGFGRRRVALVRDQLATRLRHTGRRRDTNAAGHMPPVALVLDVDAEYRRRAATHQLRRIAPRRFNPSEKRWLPVLHTEREGWDVTAMYSNTALAHRLGRTRDWVVVFYQRDEEDGQCTVVTERRGADAGRRVIRGHEAPCSAHYRAVEPCPGGAGQRDVFPARKAALGAVGS